MENIGQLKAEIAKLSDKGITFKEHSFSSGYTINPEYFDIILIKSGSGSVFYDNGRYEIGEKCMFFIHGGEKCVFTADNEQITLCEIRFTDFFLYPFDERTITYLSIPFANRKFMSQLTEEEYDDVLKTISKINAKISVSSDYDRIYLITALNWILLNYMVSEAERPMGTRKHYVADDIVFRVHNQFFTKDFSVKKLADDVSLSADYTSLLFKKITGVSIQRYVLDKRLELAYDMLLRTKVTVSQICDGCGFNNYSYFMRAFKKKYGCTPLSVREKMASSAKAEDTSE